MPGEGVVANRLPVASCDDAGETRQIGPVSLWQGSDIGDEAKWQAGVSQVIFRPL